MRSNVTCQFGNRLNSASIVVIHNKCQQLEVLSTVSQRRATLKALINIRVEEF